MLKTGDVVDNRYEVLKEIGRGGMSIVYLAMDNRLNKSLVIKDIRKRDNSNNKLLVDSLVVEANMLKKLDHGALPKIYDIIDSDGDIYVVMDYIEGESLKQKLDREQFIPANLVIDWAHQLADVLGYLHTRKPNPIIYRDMKPDNVMLTPDGSIKLIDFGIAREYKIESSTDTTNLGTKSYAAPEQISNKQTDARTDIYSLGVTLYHLVTGKSLNDPPFELKPIRYWDASLPEGLEHIITKCTQSEPGNRYQSCDELLFDIENIDKLTKGYKKQLYKKLSGFSVPAVLFFVFTGTSVWGYNGINAERDQNYLNLTNQASQALIDGEQSRAIELLEEAIIVDNKSADAYMNLLDIYINRGETEAGLSKIQAYIDREYGNTHENNELLFKVGMTYFDVQKDYNTALTYFRDVEEDELPAAKYYKTLATTMSSLNIDYQAFAQELLEFEDFNNSLPNDQKKLDNFNALATVYMSYKSQIPDANTSAINVIEKALDVLSILDEEQYDLLYELSFERKLAQSYHSRGINSQDATEAKEDLSDAIEHYNTLLDNDVEDQESIMTTIGVIYQDMGEYSQAEEQYRLTINNYPENISAHVNLINLLLDVEQAKEESGRNYSRATSVFQDLEEIPDVHTHEEYKKLSRRFNTINQIN